MNHAFLSLLGLCRRAGKLTIGCEAVKGSVLKGEARLVILAEDISKHTQQDVLFHAKQAGTPFVQAGCGKDALGAALGKYASVIAVNDTGFAKKLKQLAPQQQNERGGM